VVVEESTQDARDVVMSDDGKGSDIHIPSILVEEEEVTTLIKWMGRNKDNLDAGIGPIFPILKISFEIAKKEDKVNYDIWFTTEDLESLKFLR
jgi:hypothetical protein